ncbi:alpha/beta hydrolase [Massilia rubra]|uniref:Alpha/beta fold hydrolase n=1 Tax=Massilia rubra TaxID=2607910 RepID=A0ABX0LES5_9BURK|nr:alpha/beta fold hydrolase [Massilia rubra]NHZ33328.1 alpha/beta fold hydrolase [Massilia rubra]
MQAHLPKGSVRLIGAVILISLIVGAAYLHLRPARPQLPAFFPPYQERTVLIDNAAASVQLAGTLSLPQGSGPFPAIILVPGAGEVERDGELFGHKFYLVLADYFTRQGYAVLRTDKRGLGASGGNYNVATGADFASDLKAAVALLRGRGDIAPQRIGLIGHSEGAMIAAMAAGDDSAIAFVVMLGGNGVSGERLLLDRLSKVTMAGKPPAMVDRELALQHALFAHIVDTADPAQRSEKLRQLLVQARSDHGRPFSDTELTTLSTPWMRAFLRTDPQVVLGKVHCPVLALIGEKDQVVLASTNAPALAHALRANAAASVRRLPGLNHFFQHAPTGSFAEVAEIEETFSPDVLELVRRWTAAQQGRR